MNHKSTLRQRARQARDSRHDQMRKLAAMDTRSLLDDTLQVAQHADSFTPDDYIEYLFAVRVLRCRIEKAETGALLMDALSYMLDAVKWMSAVKKMYPDLLLPTWVYEMLEGKTLT